MTQARQVRKDERNLRTPWHDLSQRSNNEPPQNRRCRRDSQRPENNCGLSSQSSGGYRMNWTDWTSPSKHPTTVSFASSERFCAGPYEHVRFARLSGVEKTMRNLRGQTG